MTAACGRRVASPVAEAGYFAVTYLGFDSVVANFTVCW